MTIFAQASLPQLPPPDSIVWTQQEAVAVSKPLFGMAVTQRVRYGVQRWQARIKYSKLTQAQRHLLLRFADNVGLHRAFWVTDFSAVLRGAFPAVELLGAAAQGGTFWTGNTNRVITTDVDGARVTRSGATAASGVGMTTAATVTANAAYALRMGLEPGNASSFSFQLTAGSARFGTTYGTSITTSVPKRLYARVVPTASPMYVNVADSINLDANWTQTGYYLMRNASLCRAISVDGGTGSLTQVGSALYVKDCPTNTAALLVPGDMVELITPGFSQLLRITENLNSDGSGKGHIRFEGQLRAAVSADALIVPITPQCMMCMTEPVQQTTNPPGYTSDVEFVCEEVFE